MKVSLLLLIAAVLALAYCAALEFTDWNGNVAGWAFAAAACYAGSKLPWER